MVEIRNACNFWLESLKGKDKLEDLGADGYITLEEILGK
jgi:hypothetical protein